MNNELYRSFDMTWEQTDLYKVVRYANESRSYLTTHGPAITTTTARELVSLTKIGGVSVAYSVAPVFSSATAYAASLGASVSAVSASASFNGVGVSVGLSAAALSISAGLIQSSRSTWWSQVSNVSITDYRMAQLTAPLVDASMTDAGRSADLQGHWPALSHADLVEHMGADWLMMKTYPEVAQVISSSLMTGDVFGMEARLEALKWDPRFKLEKGDLTDLGAINETPSWKPFTLDQLKDVGGTFRLTATTGNTPAIQFYSRKGRTFTFGPRTGISFGPSNDVYAAQRGVSAKNEYRYIWEQSDYFYNRHSTEFTTFHQTTARSYTDAGESETIEGRAAQYLQPTSYQAVGRTVLLRSIMTDVADLPPLAGASSPGPEVSATSPTSSASTAASTTSTTPATPTPPTPIPDLAQCSTAGGELELSPLAARLAFRTSADISTGTSIALAKTDITVAAGTGRIAVSGDSLIVTASQVAFL